MEIIYLRHRHPLYPSKEISEYLQLLVKFWKDFFLLKSLKINKMMFAYLHTQHFV